MKVWEGTPYANVFKGSRSLASIDVLKNPSLSEALKNRKFEAMRSSINTWNLPLDSLKNSLNWDPCKGVRGFPMRPVKSL
jgi:hypothetical protein